MLLLLTEPELDSQTSYLLTHLTSRLPLHAMEKKSGVWLFLNTLQISGTRLFPWHSKVDLFSARLFAYFRALPGFF